LTTLKQAVKWLAEEGHLPPSCTIRLPLAKPQGTTTYCWRADEVRAMLRHCRQHPELLWLSHVLTALALPGLPISEPGPLGRAEVDRDSNVITLTDESTRARRTGQKARQTRSGRSRSFPIHGDLRPVLEGAAPAPDGLVFHGPRGAV